MNIVLHSLVKIESLSPWRSISPCLVALDKIRMRHSPQTTLLASFNPERSVFLVYMISVYIIPKRKFHSDWRPDWTHSGMTFYGNKISSRYPVNRCKEIYVDGMNLLRNEVIPVPCKQPLRYVDWWIFIHPLNKNRRQKALYTRLLLVDNARRSKCFLTMVKMWIKEIRFYFSVFGYQVKNLNGNMDLSWSKLL